MLTEHSRSTIHVDTLGREHLPQHLQRTHMLQAVHGGIIVTQNKAASARFELPMPPLQPSPDIKWTSQHLSPPEDRRRSHPTGSKRRQPPSVSYAASRSVQPAPPIVLHQPPNEIEQEKATFPDKLQLQQLTKAISAAYSNETAAPERVVLEILENFQRGKGPIHPEPTSHLTCAVDTAVNMPIDVAMDDVSADNKEAKTSSDESAQDVDSSDGGIQCKQCNKILKRDCDMRYALRDTSEAKTIN